MLDRCVWRAEGVRLPHGGSGALPRRGVLEFCRSWQIAPDSVSGALLEEARLALKRLLASPSSTHAAIVRVDPTKPMVALKTSWNNV